MGTSLTLDIVRQAVAGSAASFRAIVDFQPAGGQGDKVFPATYEKGQYATEERIIGTDRIPCVVIDSVQSQANRMEMALLDAWDRKRISLPIISLRFEGEGIKKPFRVTSLDAPHRIADALLRDALLDGTPFRQSRVGSALNDASPANATRLFELCPTALLFGMWDSTGPRGGLGVRIQRAVVSEIVGVNVVQGKRTSSRIDPAQIPLSAGPLYQSKDQNGISWTLDEKQAAIDKGKPKKIGKEGKPSEANHGNVTPTIADGGFTIQYARQTSVISLPALRRLSFPVSGSASSTTTVDDVARTALTVLALCAATLSRSQGCDLRSRCFLLPTTPFEWQLIGEPGVESQTLTLNTDQAVTLLKEALEAATKAGLPWHGDEIALQPSPQLLELVRRSQEQTAAAPVEE
jgi:CRISPR-associated protein Csb1